MTALSRWWGWLFLAGFWLMATFGKSDTNLFYFCVSSAFVGVFFQLNAIHETIKKLTNPQGNEPAKDD